MKHERNASRKGKTLAKKDKVEETLEMLQNFIKSRAVPPTNSENFTFSRRRII